MSTPPRRAWRLALMASLVVAAIALGLPGACSAHDASAPARAPIADTNVAATHTPLDSETDGGLQAAVKTPPRPPASPTAARPTLPRIDPLELSLLAQLERELGGEPPPEVHTLLAAYRQGATHTALVEHVQTKFPRDLQLRVLTLRWLDRTFPEAASAKASKPAPRETKSKRPWLGTMEQKAQPR